MKEKKMSNHLQIKVKKYLECMFNENHEQKKKIFFDSLNNSLREEVHIDIYAKILKNNKFLEQNFSEPFLNRLSLEFHEITLAPEEIIFNVKSLFFSNNSNFFASGMSSLKEECIFL